MTETTRRERDGETRSPVRPGLDAHTWPKFPRSSVGHPLRPRISSGARAVPTFRVNEWSDGRNLDWRPPLRWPWAAATCHWESGATRARLAMPAKRAWAPQARPEVTAPPRTTPVHRMLNALPSRALPRLAPKRSARGSTMGSATVLRACTPHRRLALMATRPVA